MILKLFYSSEKSKHTYKQKIHICFFKKHIKSSKFHTISMFSFLLTFFSIYFPFINFSISYFYALLPPSLESDFLTLLKEVFISPSASEILIVFIVEASNFKEVNHRSLSSDSKKLPSQYPLLLTPHK